MTTEAPQQEDTLRVRAPISDPEPGGLQFETMHARKDPAADDQAVLVNAPFFCDYVNYGDLIRVGEPQDGACPLLEVVTASGHCKVVTITGGSSIVGLGEYLTDLYANHELRMEGDGKTLLCVSVHPDVVAEGVRDNIADWLDDNGESPDTASISPPIQTVLGTVEWPDA